jgi:hypothetical protein
MTTLPFSVVSLQGLTLRHDGEEETVTLNDMLIHEIASTAYQSHHIGTLMRILVPQIMGRGFNIEVEFKGQHYKVTDPLEHATLYNLWEPLVPKILRQLFYYGLVVVNLIRRDHMPEPYNVLPQVMDLDSEVSVKFTIKKNKERVYRAFLRQRSLTNLPTKEIELTNAVVYVMDPEPSFDGQVSSAMQQVLELCAQAAGYAVRRELQDVRATLRERVYYQDPGKDAVIDTTLTINAANSAANMPMLPGYAMTDGMLPRDYVPPAGGVVRGQLEHRELVLERGNGFQVKEHKRLADQLNGGVPDQLTTRVWNPQLGRHTTQPALDIWTPEKVLAQYTRLEHGGDYNFTNGNYVNEYDLLIRNIASRFGVPFEWVVGGKASITSEVDSMLKQFDSTVRSWQKTLEKLFATLFLNIHGNEYIEEVKSRFTADALKQSGKKSVGEIEERPSKRQKIVDYEEEHKDDSESSSSSSSSDEESTPSRRFFLSDNDIELLKAAINVTVHFNENPVITQEVINTFEERNYITRESAADLSFRLAGLPESYKATPAQLAEDAKLRKKLEELSTPKPVEGAAGGKPKPSKPGAKAADSS